MSKIKDYLEAINVPSSTIQQLMDEKSELTDYQVIDLAAKDGADIGKIYAKSNPDPKNNEKFIIDIKNLKAGTFKLLQKLGAEMGELSRNKVEEMDTDTFLKSINDPLNGYIEKVKGATDEKVSSELKLAVAKISELTDEIDNLNKNFTEKETSIRSEVEKEKQNHLLNNMLNDLDNKASWGFKDKALDMIKESGRNKIHSLGIKIDEKGNVTNLNGGPATDPNGKIVRNLAELHKGIYEPAFKVSNGNGEGNVIAGIEIPDIKDAKNTNAMLERMKEQV